jgi:hypothetical protein
MQRPERKLHSLEKIVVLFALAAVLFVSVGFAQGAGPKRKAQAQLPDKMALRSSVALVQDADSGETLFDKNSETVLPIASITKLMTAMVVLEHNLDLDDRVVISQDDVVATRSSRIRGRLRPGSALTRDELLLLALMAWITARRLAAPTRAAPRRSSRDEPRGRAPRPARHALLRSDGPFAVQRLQRAGPGQTGEGGARPSADPRVLDAAQRLRQGTRRQGRLQQHQ